ncbi:response regulator transcription factor [Clostridium sp. AL.422]|uniref:response regulator transcription factor n=1 Tax=Clostridium TaxID=1485 RepID=UPI00293DCE7B|nr:MULTISPECIES: response regulator transcription factor [unclassified Clostridium]MDV4150906.1 response regulator transcription factor [Clostridium sp. AL.422]
MKIKVMIADDKRFMREGLKTIINLEEDLAVVQLCESGKEALEKIPSVIPDVLIMDISIPVMEVIEYIKIIKQQYPSVRIVILTAFDDDEFIIEVLKNGAVGYILKDLPLEKLISAIRDAYNRNSIIQPEIAEKIISHMSEAINHNNFHSINKDTPKRIKSAMYKEEKNKCKLTEREREILHLVGKGLSNIEIAKSLYISVGTVKNYISNLYSKLQIVDRSKLILYAIKETSYN